MPGRSTRAFHAAGTLARIGVGDVRETHGLRKRIHATFTVLRSDVFQLQSKADVGSNSSPGEQRGILKDKGHDFSCVDGCHTFNADCARGEVRKPRNQFEQGLFNTADRMSCSESTPSAIRRCGAVAPTVDRYKPGCYCLGQWPIDHAVLQRM
jgi:hypothetical protein